VSDDAAELARLDEIVARLGIEGWCTAAERALLYRLARHGPGAGAIVEVGSWKGLSTIFLAAGSRAAGREPVRAVDSFRGSPLVPDSLATGTLDEFRRNLVDAGVADHVEVVVADSTRAGAEWQGGPVRLLYLDANHDYEAVARDLAAWQPWVMPGGVVAFHDAIEPTWPGVGQVLDEQVGDGTWCWPGLSGTIVSVVRAPAPAPDWAARVERQGIYATLRGLVAERRRLEADRQALAARVDDLRQREQTLQARLTDLEGEWRRKNDHIAHLEQALHARPGRWGRLRAWVARRARGAED
jgi:predicted O-methyltransferase YrrM